MVLRSEAGTATLGGGGGGAPRLLCGGGGGRFDAGGGLLLVGRAAGGGEMMGRGSLIFEPPPRGACAAVGEASPKTGSGASSMARTNSSIITLEDGKRSSGFFANAFAKY
jgi:hypothetical protein